MAYTKQLIPQYARTHSTQHMFVQCRHSKNVRRTTRRIFIIEPGLKDSNSLQNDLCTVISNGKWNEYGSEQGESRETRVSRTHQTNKRVSVLVIIESLHSPVTIQCLLKSTDGFAFFFVVVCFSFPISIFLTHFIFVIFLVWYGTATVSILRFLSSPPLQNFSYRYYLWLLECEFHFDQIQNDILEWHREGKKWKI